MDAAFNIRLYQLLSDWNPMNFEDKTSADQEVYDCMDIIHKKAERSTTIQQIQHVYQFAFEIEVPAVEIEKVLQQVDLLEQTCQL